MLYSVNLIWLKFLFERSSYLALDTTRMTTFMKQKFKKSDDQTNIDKYRAAANITEYHSISKLILLRIIFQTS